MTIDMRHIKRGTVTTGVGWTCAYCGMWVGANEVHHCPSWVYTTEHHEPPDFEGKVLSLLRSIEYRLSLLEARYQPEEEK